MIRRLFLSAFFPLLLIVFVPSLFRAQGRLVHKIESEIQSAPPNGRDFWFTIPQNYLHSGASGIRYFYIYISSTRNTTAYVQVGAAAPLVRNVPANQTITVQSVPTNLEFPTSTELTSSGVVENRAIHVWSNDAELSVYFLSRSLQTSDGMYCIPTVGWGTEYVVGSFNAYDLVSAALADLPSEFSIVANEDQTYVTIIPTYDIRKDGFPTQVAHPKGVPFTQLLNKGECIQYQTTTESTYGTDLSGTYISSTKPVGVIGASVCPNIPDGDPACDHIIDMLPPIRTWAKNYFSAPFQGRKYGGDMFLVIGTKPGQVIKRNGAAAVSLTQAHDFLFVPDITQPSLWTSDTAFELIQYIQSKTHGTTGTGTGNNGDPAMVVINPAEQFGKKIIFQIPKDVTLSGLSFSNVLNIIVPVSHESKTTIDGRPLTNPGTGLTLGGKILTTTLPQRQVIPGTQWEVVYISSLSTAAEGSHVIASDTSVGLYIYGETDYDSYAWAGALGVRSPNNPDTLPPIAVPKGLCFCATIKLWDNRPIDTKINSMSYDTIFNMGYYPDPTFTFGSETIDSTYYEICVIDSSKPAYIRVNVTDRAGNMTTITSTYEPPLIQYHPVVVNFGSGQIGVGTYQYDTICNIGTADFAFGPSHISLLDFGKGFSIDSVGAEGVIPPGGCRVIKLKYVPKIASTATTTILYDDGCILLDQPLIGNGGAADFQVHDYDFRCVKPGVTATTTNFFIENTSKFILDVDSIWVDDPVHFGFDKLAAGNTLPVTIPVLPTQSGRAERFLTFSPTTTTAYQTIAHFYDRKDDIERTAILRGEGCSPSITATDQNGSSDCDIPVSVRIQFENTGTQSDSLQMLVSSDTVKFSHPKLDDGSGNQISAPLKFDIGKSIYASVVFTPPDSTSGCFADTIYLVHPNGDTAAQGIAKVCAVYRSYDITVGSVDFGSVPFGNPKVSDHFEFCNTATDPLTISAFDAFPSKDSAAFRLTGVYKVGAATVGLPIVLQKDECVDVFVEFDPSFILDAAQIGSFGITTNACTQPNRTFAAQGETTSGAPLIQGFTLPAMLSCNSRDSSVFVNNNELVPKTIDSVWIDGPDAAKFVLNQTLPVPIPPVSKAGIRIGFDPNGGLGPQTYTAKVHVIVSDGSRKDTLSVPIGGSTNNMVLGVTSSFAKTGLHFGDTAVLNIDLKLNKNGLTESLSSLDVRSVILTYTYDIDLLDLTDLAAGFSSPLGWTADLTSSVLPTTANPQLKLVLTRLAPLDDADGSLGMLKFRATLPKTTPSSQMTLTSLTLLDKANDTVRSCLVTNHIDTSITIIYQCGDSTILKFMNGQAPTFGIAPAIPNPITGANHTATLRYLLRREASVSLSIFDPLGNRIAVLEDNMHHPAGSFEIYYDTETLPSGNYIYRFTFDGKDVRSGRLVIER